MLDLRSLNLISNVRIILSTVTSTAKMLIKVTSSGMAALLRLIHAIRAMVTVRRLLKTDLLEITLKA